MIKDEITTTIISAIVGAISGGLVNYFLELRRDRRNDKKERIKENEEIHKNRPELDIISYQDHYYENTKDVERCNIEVFVAGVEHFKTGKNVSAVYNNSDLDKTNWHCFSYLFKNMGGTDINSINILMSSKEYVCLFESNEVDYMLSKGVINYSICYDKKIRVGETVSLKLIYNKDRIPVSIFSSIMLIGLRDDNGRTWEQPFFAPEDKIYESHQIDSAEYNRMLRSDDVYDKLEKVDKKLNVKGVN